MQKHVLLSLFALLFALPAWSQGIRHQGVLRDNGSLLQSQNIGVQYIIREGTPAGTMVYNETVNTQTDAYGVFAATIGEGDPVDFATIDWSQGPFFLEVIVNGTNLGTTEIAQVPLAFHADEAETVLSLDNHTLSAISDVDGTAPASDEVLKWNGSSWAPAPDETGVNIVAFGTINDDGTIYASNSGNFTVTWDATSGRYEISITGESYFFRNYTCLVTLFGQPQQYTVGTSSVGGDLLIYVEDETGARVQEGFQFMVIKP